MLKKRIEVGVVIGLVVACLAAFSYWFLYNPVSDLSVSLPGLDNRPAAGEGDGEIVTIGASFMKYAQHQSDLQGKWTNFRGADFDNIVKDETPLIDQFGAEGPKIVWEHDLGDGYAAPVIYNGKVYVLDYVESRRTDALRCFSLETGEELWSRWYLVKVKRNHGMSRTIPAITDKYLVTIGPRCHVMCVNPENGDLLWTIDMVKEYGTEVPFWYTGQCPIIIDDIAIFAPGGSALMIGVDCATGEVVWETPNPDKLGMSHSSIIPMTIHGKKMFVYMALNGTVGVSAEGDDVGTVLWKTRDFIPNVIAASPILLPGNRIYGTAGYGAGGIVFKVNKEGNTYSTELLQKYKPKDGLASEQQTPILYNGYLFGIQPKDAAGYRNQFVCVNADDPQNILWTSGRTDRFGLGPYVIADDKFFIVNDDGTLNIARLSTSGFELLDKRRIIEGHDAWGPIALADGYLIMRETKKMVCLDMRVN
ncbi:MAG: hypothetical protein CL663_00535 [Bacteroidetes bacterium]|nr:hypothetical protein [Bacteroidota bacterium]